MSSMLTKQLRNARSLSLGLVSPVSSWVTTLYLGIQKRIFFHTLLVEIHGKRAYLGYDIQIFFFFSCTKSFIFVLVCYNLHIFKLFNSSKK